MIWRRRLLIGAGVLFLLWLVVQGWITIQMQQFARNGRAVLTREVPGLQIDSLTATVFPFPAFIGRGISVDNPEYFSSPTALAIPKIRIGFSPWWWMLRKVVLADLEIDSPSVTIERNTEGHSNWEDRLEEMPKESLGQFLPRRIRIRNGSLDLIDRRMKPDGVLVPLRNLQVDYDLTALKAHGDFVDDAERAVGGVRFDIQFQMMERRLTGQVRFEHRSLSLLQPYLSKRTGYRMADGDGYADVTGTITTDQKFECEITLVARKLDLQGGEPVLGMPIENLLRQLRDEQGEIRLRFKVTGRLNDPTFNFHTLMVRGLEQAILNRLQEKGIPIAESH